MEQRETIKSKKRIVIKVGTTTITHKETGNIDLEKLEKFVRILINLRNKGKEVIVVSSGAVGIGRQVLGIWERLEESAIKQACAAVGQGRMMMMYEKLFAEYDQLTAQVLLTKESIMSKECRQDARNTFEELLRMNVVPIVNENDAISVEEEAYGNFGDNDTMAAHVARLVEADLLILMSDIEGLYTDDPRKNPNARFVHTVRYIDEKLERMGKGAGSAMGTGGMATKIELRRLRRSPGQIWLLPMEPIFVQSTISWQERRLEHCLWQRGKTGGKSYEIHGTNRNEKQGGEQEYRLTGTEQKKRGAETGSKRIEETSSIFTGRESKRHCECERKRNEGISYRPIDAD